MLPEGRPLTRPAARDEERAGRVLTEARAEERRLPHLLDDELLDLVGLDEQVRERGRRVCVRQVERDPVVRPERLRLERQRVAEPRRERHRPGRVHAPAERRENADAPVADLVAEPLDDDRPVGRERRAALLLAQEDEEVLARQLVEVVLLSEPLRRLGVGERGQLTGCRADPRTELVWPPHSLALPERHRTRDTGRMGDEHPVARDLLDPPGRGAEHEGLPLARLVDHLLVELANPAAAVRLEDAVHAAVRDRPGVRHREPPGPVLPRITPAVRSHTIRGRSSANSSDG